MARVRTKVRQTPAEQLNEVVAANVRALAAERGVSRRRLAQELGVAITTLSTKLRVDNPMPVSLEELALLADYFGVSRGSLLEPRGWSANRCAPRESNSEPTDKRPRPAAA